MIDKIPEKFIPFTKEEENKLEALVQKLRDLSNPNKPRVINTEIMKKEEQPKKEYHKRYKNYIRHQDIFRRIGDED